MPIGVSASRTAAKDNFSKTIPVKASMIVAEPEIGRLLTRGRAIWAAVAQKSPAAAAPCAGIAPGPPGFAKSLVKRCQDEHDSHLGGDQAQQRHDSAAGAGRSRTDHYGDIDDVGARQ